MDADLERRLVRRAGKGDGTALQQLFVPHRDRAYRLAYRLTGSHADADDVLQEAWLRAFRGISTFDGHARFGTWLYRIVLNAAADCSRRQARANEVEGARLNEEPVADGQGPIGSAEAAELGQALQTALHALPWDQREALVLVAFEGMTYAQAAAVQQCAEGTLAWRVAEARRRLARRLAPYVSGGGREDEV